MRVNNVRNGWRGIHPDGLFDRSFYDSSIWEKSEASDPEALKNLMREAVENTSAVCVQRGKYLARPLGKIRDCQSGHHGRGLLAVHINGLNHHQRRAPDPNGYNPLRLMGIYHSHDGRYYLCEYQKVMVSPLLGQFDWQWRLYEDFKGTVSLPKYFPAINQGGSVIPLAAHTFEHDYAAHDGATNIGAWIDRAATAVGR